MRRIGKPSDDMTYRLDIIDVYTWEKFLICQNWIEKYTIFITKVNNWVSYTMHEFVIIFSDFSILENTYWKYLTISWNRNKYKMLLLLECWVFVVLLLCHIFTNQIKTNGLYDMILKPISFYDTFSLLPQVIYKIVFNLML